ncbi:MAG: hypothetical protein F4Y26_16695 [Gammaproteobacteria bacterium]|nr:hypothetical protein [Gammaproteobacteria bacterium]
MSGAGNPRGQRSTEPKVFEIGFDKTGTKSLGAALGILGYRVCGPVGAKDPDIAPKAEGSVARWPEMVTSEEMNLPLPDAETTASGRTCSLSRYTE